MVKYGTPDANLDADSAVRLFDAGDTIAIGLPGGGYGLVVIGRLNRERMFCTSFAPRFQQFPDGGEFAAWKPANWSSWMADTLGLRDGSWVKITRPPGMSDADHIDVTSLPRFKFVDKAGHRRLAEYDPESLIVRKLIDSPNLEEYRRAPNFLPPDATTFEIALSRNLESPCELPDPESIKVMNEDREVVALLRETMTDLNLTLTFDHVLLFKRKSDAERARQQLLSEGHSVSELQTSGWLKPTAIEVRIASKAEYPLVREDINQMRLLASKFSAEYDGFGALAL